MSAAQQAEKSIGQTLKDWGNTGKRHWNQWNQKSYGFLNPTAGGAAAGMAVGGIAGGMSDDHSALGGMAMGGLAGAALGAGGYAGYNRVAHAEKWNYAAQQPELKDLANKKFSRYTNPVYHTL